MNIDLHDRQNPPQSARRRIKNLQWPAGRAKLVMVAGAANLRFAEEKRLFAEALKYVYPSLAVSDVHYDLVRPRVALSRLASALRSASEHETVIVAFVGHGMTMGLYPSLARPGSVDDLYLLAGAEPHRLDSLLTLSGRLTRRLTGRDYSHPTIRGYFAHDGPPDSPTNRTVRHEGQTYAVALTPTIRVGDPIRVAIDGGWHSIQPHRLVAPEAKEHPSEDDLWMWVHQTIRGFLLAQSRYGITGAEIARVLGRAPKQRFIVFALSCFSGSILNDPVADLPNVTTIIAATEAYEQSQYINHVGLFERRFFEQVKKHRTNLGLAFLEADRATNAAAPDLAHNPQALFRVDGTNQLATGGTPLLIE